MSETDRFWRSTSVQNGMKFFVVTTITALLGGFVWNLARTAELGAEVKAQKTLSDVQTEDIKEIKADVKKLLERLP